MSEPTDFKSTFTSTERRRASAAMLLSRPSHIPIICEKAPTSKMEGPSLIKVLIPPERQVAYLLHLIRRRTKIAPTQALFLLVEGVLPPTSMELGVLFEESRDADGFMYVV
ncbi:autophagy related protein ATG8 [Morchella snyderi]|nr:autophagy related protein ATG8 [Morchella snyderi]